MARTRITKRNIASVAKQIEQAMNEAVSIFTGYVVYTKSSERGASIRLREAQGMAITSVVIRRLYTHIMRFDDIYDNIVISFDTGTDDDGFTFPTFSVLIYA